MSRREVKVAKCSLGVIFTLLALSAVVIYVGRSNDKRERKQINLLDSINLQVDEGSCVQNGKALADVLIYLKEMMTQETLRQHNVVGYEIDMTITCIRGNGLKQLISDEYNTDCAEKLHKILPKLSLNYQTLYPNQKAETTDSTTNVLSNLAPPCVNCDDAVVHVMCAPIPEAHPNDGK